MLIERKSHFTNDMVSQQMEFYQNYNEMMLNLNQTRRMSGPMSQKPCNQSTTGMPLSRHCSPDGSQYIPSNSLNHSRFQCIQKPPLRNVVSAPVPHIPTPNRQPPQNMQQLLTRPDSLTSSVESLEPATIAELARYKTELCRPFEETGQCRYGGKCQFAHGMHELRSLNRHPKYKTELCRTFHTTGFCSYGQRCNFIHNDEERRGPSAPQSSAPSHSRPQGLMLPITSPLTITSTGESPASSITSGSPSQSPGYLNEDVFNTIRHSPTPSYGSDGASLTSSSSYSPPSSPKHELIDGSHMASPMDMGLTLSLFGRLAM